MARARVIDSETETPPEADRLKSWPHPRETDIVLGHANAEAILTEAVGSHRLHHAWLIAGEHGIGKATFAYRAVRFLLAQDHDLPPAVLSLSIPKDNKTYRQVKNMSHPGLLAIRRAWDAQNKRFRQSIAIDDIRALRHFLQRTSVTPWRVIIVDSADDLNPNSANALLKSLEEPPARTVFLLISSSPGRLLPTIRSRCRIIRLEPLGLDDLKKAVLAACQSAGHASPADNQLDTLLPLSMGSPRRALQLLEGGGLTLFKAIFTLLESLPTLDRQALHKLLSLTSARDGLAHDMAFDLLEDILADGVRARSTGSDTKQRFPRLPRFLSLMEPDNLADWAELWETIREARAETERLNLDKAALTISAFEKLQRLSQKQLKD